MDQRPLVEGRIANFVIFLDVSEFLRFWFFFFVFQKKIRFLGILGPPSYGISATIRIGREMLCLPYAGFFCFKLAGNARNQSKRHAGKKEKYFKLGYNTFFHILKTVKLKKKIGHTNFRKHQNFLSITHTLNFIFFIFLKGQS